MRKPLTVLGVVALVATGAGVAAAAPQVSRPQAEPTSDRTALLITGDVVRVHELGGGRATYDVEPAAARGPARSLVHLGLGGRNYEIPATAVPYLGRGLDLGLFDVDRAASDHVTTPARTFDRAAARSFGAQLAQQYAHDRARGSFGGLFADVSGPSAEKQPRGVLNTLTLAADEVDGTPSDTGISLLTNLDDSTLVDENEALNFFYDGTAKYSVPAGNYSAISVFFTTAADGSVSGVREVVNPEFTVKADATVRMDARKATSKVTWVTPRPALLDDNGFFLRRAPKTGPAVTFDYDAGPGVPMWISPVAKAVRTGELQTYPYAHLISPPGTGLPYEYWLQKASSGTIPKQRYTPTEADFATVDASYYSELPSLGRHQRSGMFPFETVSSRPSVPIPLPRRQIEYVQAAPGLLWFGGSAKYFRADDELVTWYGDQRSTSESYRGGEHKTEGYNKFPLHPAGATAVGAAIPSSSFVVPGVVRDGDDVAIDLVPFTDNEPGHTGTGTYGEPGDLRDGHYRLTQDGAVVEEGPSGEDVQFTQPVGAAPSVLGLTVDATHSGPMFRLSTATHTEWSWRSQHVDGPVLPAPLICRISKGQAPDTACGVEPLLMPTYAVGGLGLDGATPHGPQTLDVTFARMQAAASSTVSSATVQFSTDGGSTWQDALVTPGGGGTFRAAYSVVPESPDGTDVALRVTAADAGGSTVDETLTAAYHVKF
ncbi:hypothetical protein VSH64_44760 [Amycolatopsis rhabdoformis]|uniref:Peptidase n=1 Tax=Amycolatopsis rhabdoformis TaxID=1448059 RepID=A0ABZ1I6J7_9PSEU|nr:hypothetical protein [Amycolatopsis rhabdoformis]WSE29829.1 hypothetical protein VSH64_44760 [Amycolatopsis rhabdoformis]